MNDLTADSVMRTLGDDVPYRVEVYDTLDSTNNFAKLRGRAGDGEGLVVIARSQTAGRGRMGHDFHSPPTGLYLSILLRPHLLLEKSLLLTTAAAVCVAEACEALSGRRTNIKWVNDVYMDGRKVCGILTESALKEGMTMPDFSVVGIGVNVLMPKNGFPPEIADTAGVVFHEGDAERIPKLAAEILRRFSVLYAELTAFPDTPQFLERYRTRMLGLHSKIQVLRGNEIFEAVLEDIDDDFRLHLRTQDGQRMKLSSGEIRIRPLP